MQSEFTPNSCEIIIKNCQTSKQQTQLILSTTIIDAGLLILLIARILNDFSHFWECFKSLDISLVIRISIL